MWKWLKNSSNQKILALLGSGLAAIIIAAWTVYVHFFPSIRPVASNNEIQVEATCSFASSDQFDAGDITIFCGVDRQELEVHIGKIFGQFNIGELIEANISKDKNNNDLDELADKLGVSNAMLNDLLREFKESRSSSDSTFAEFTGFVLARSSIALEIFDSRRKDRAGNEATERTDTLSKGPIVEKAEVLKEGAWATAVIDVRQGRKKNGLKIRSERSIASRALGPAETKGATRDSISAVNTALSLGFGGTLTLYFENAIFNGPGMDGQVYEITMSTGPYPDEKVKVEVSDNGIVWDVAVQAGTRDTMFDLGKLRCASFVRLTDVTESKLHEQGADAFDVDAVKALNAQRGACR